MYRGSFGVRRKIKNHPVFDALKKRLLVDLGLDADNFKRLYPGYWQRSEGAWTWCCRAYEGRIEIGSSDPAKDCLKAERLVISGENIYAERLKEGNRG